MSDRAKPWRYDEEGRRVWGTDSDGDFLVAELGGQMGFGDVEHMKEDTMTKKKFRIPARQGDVLIIATTKPAPIGDEVKDPRGVVLADGESSGHFHAVVGDGAKLFRFRSSARDRLLVVGDGGAEVRVVGGGSGELDRHAVVSLAPGQYTIRTQREWSIADERALHSPD